MIAQGNHVSRQPSSAVLAIFGCSGNLGPFWQSCAPIPSLPYPHHVSQGFSGVGAGAGGHVFGRAECHHLAALVSTLRSQVDDVVSSFHYVEVVLYHNNGIAGDDQPVEDPEQ